MAQVGYALNCVYHMNCACRSSLRSVVYTSGVLLNETVPREPLSFVHASIDGVSRLSLVPHTHTHTHTYKPDVQNPQDVLYVSHINRETSTVREEQYHPNISWNKYNEGKIITPTLLVNLQSSTRKKRVTGLTA